MTTQALAPLERLLPAEPIAKIGTLKATFDALRPHCNLVSPITQVDHIMALHQVSLRAVVIDPTCTDKKAGPDCYFDARFCQGDEVALGKNAITKIMAAAGVQIADRVRLDDRSDPNYCEVQVTLAVMDFDGSIRQFIASKEMDLRPGAPETMKPEWDERTKKKTGRMVPMEDTALADKRRHIQSHAETKAIERGVRGILSLRQTYKRAELERPFVVPKLVGALDPNDPGDREALRQHALHGERMLFGAKPVAADTRTIRELSPAPASKTPSPMDPEPPEEPTKPQAGADAFELLPDAEPEPPKPDGLVCWCPCGCKKEITPEASASTIEAVGAPRCRACYPGKGFDPAMHDGVGSLELPKKPDLTAEKVTVAVMAANKAAAK